MPVAPLTARLRRLAGAALSLTLPLGLLAGATLGATAALAPAPAAALITDADLEGATSEVEPNATTANAMVVTSGQTVLGKTQRVAMDADVDMYAIDVAAGEELSVDLRFPEGLTEEAVGAAYHLTVYTAKDRKQATSASPDLLKELLFSVVGPGDSDGSELAAKRVVVPTGRVWVEVRGHRPWPSWGQGYALRLTRTAAQRAVQGQVTPLTLGKPTQGLFDDVDRDGEIGSDLDVYQVTVPQAGYLWMSLSIPDPRLGGRISEKTAVSTTLTLSREPGLAPAAGDLRCKYVNGMPDNNCLFAVQAGTWYVKLTDQVDDGNVYLLTPSFSPTKPGVWRPPYDDGKPANPLSQADGGVRTTQPECVEAVFSDVPCGRAFKTEIEWMARAAVSTGYADGTYRPAGDVTRDAMAAFLYRVAGSPAYTPPATSPFSDVPTTHPFYKQIAWLAQSGVSTGYADGTFRPSDPVSRDAMAAFLYRLAGSPAHTPPAQARFSDVPTTHPFYREVSWLASTGVTTGYADGTFHPAARIARDAMAAFLYRYAAA